MIESYFKSSNQDFTLLQGNCCKLLRDFDFQFDCIFADPPYFLSNGGISVQSGKVVNVNKGKWDKGKTPQEMTEFNMEWLNLCREKLKDNGGEEKILRETGKVIAPHNNGLILKWCMENVPEVKEAIEKETALYGTMDTWLIWKLTEGKTHAVACSNASSSGCVNVQKGVLNEEFIQNLGVPLKLFPSIASEASEYGVTIVFG